MTWGTPTPATTRVVQIEPGPTPTLTPSAPASTRACAPSRVATLPPTTCTSVSRLSRRTMSSTCRLWPCAVSTTIRSTPASISVRARLYESSPTPTAAPTTSRPSASLVASGYWSDLTKSLTVMSPVSRPLASIRGSFSILRLASSAKASSEEMPGCAVTSGIGVMTSRASREWSGSKRMSRLVTMPTSTPAASTTGTPEMR